jgi:hypothetical protein
VREDEDVLGVYRPAGSRHLAIDSDDIVATTGLRRQRLVNEPAHRIGAAGAPEHAADTAIAEARPTGARHHGEQHHVRPDRLRQRRGIDGAGRRHRTRSLLAAPLSVQEGKARIGDRHVFSCRPRRRQTIVASGDHRQSWLRSA